MKLLILTQAIDRDDQVLAFFIRWIEELAPHFEIIEAVCLKEGEYALPANVRVHSLGKPASRFRYVWNFYRYIFSLSYDAVFVHMNQEYALLGGLVWKCSRRKMYLWRNHAKGNFFTRVAVLFSHQVFCTSSRSFTARFKKTKIMPVGIDTDFFRPNPTVLKKPNAILFLGRIAPVKNVAVFVDALNELQKLNVEFTATIAGGALVKDAGYEEMVRRKVSDYGLAGRVQFIGSVTQDKALHLYQEHELYVNLTPPGSMDKTIFEAMACGVTPLVYNDDLARVAGEAHLIKDGDARGVARAMKRLLSGERQDFRGSVVENHSLKLLAEKLSAELK